ncbi:(2E,6E)-farnesyl diphosphate synthase [Alteromonas halophila]|uniref:(2E,6E)-farnesyl diphosphate synthase n=1 Tax=Alteromonas halophila TaxID=516698 RepID=A0A918JLP9_9ALTE|nr:farnesyl diphosphate synthase [Alteromonas halophila]GGW85761.1 (2E,6E)-farnesyl diphosphate synthase [Alteromonas halophila]
MTITALHSQVKADTDEALLDMLASFPDHAPQLKAAMQHALLAGGKRLRPLLVHVVGEVLALDKSDCMTIACAVECIHAYSLVHDDLPAMDDDDLRRGKPTCHVAFDEATAILAGDALQTLAFSIIADAPMADTGHARRAGLVSMLARASGYLGMCGGQAIDLAATGKEVSVEALTQLHSLKTGALLRVCVEMATHVADDLDAEHRSALIRFADAIGLAFQVQDDILDVEGSSDTTGKPAGSDVALGKSTYPALLGLQAAKSELDRLHQQALQALQGLPYNTHLLVAFSELLVKRDH